MTNIVGNNIKTLRESMESSQSMIAHFLNVDQSLISKVEKGERNLSVDMLEKLAYLFGVSIDAIESSPIEASSLSAAFRESELSAEDKEMFAAFSGENMKQLNLPELRTKIAAPAIIVIPIAIYA